MDPTTTPNNLIALVETLMTSFEERGNYLRDPDQYLQSNQIEFPSEMHPILHDAIAALQREFDQLGEQSRVVGEPLTSTQAEPTMNAVAAAAVVSAAAAIVSAAAAVTTATSAAKLAKD